MPGRNKGFQLTAHSSQEGKGAKQVVLICTHQRHSLGCSRGAWEAYAHTLLLVHSSHTSTTVAAHSPPPSRQLRDDGCSEDEGSLGLRRRRHRDPWGYVIHTSTTIAVIAAPAQLRHCTM